MNRKERRALLSEQRSFVGQFPPRLTLVSEVEYGHMNPRPDKVWRSAKYLVQLYKENNEVIRLSICRTRLGANGRWEDGLSWDELQSIKREIGYGNWYAIEIYPRDKDIVNVANMRHLWLLPKPLEIRWFK